MSAVAAVVHDGTVMALIRRSSDIAERGVTFVTPPDYPLQVGVLNHPSGSEIKPHIHRDIVYEVNTTQEFIYVEHGHVEITLYTDDWTEVERSVLGDGDFVLFVRGGHSLKVLDDARMVEVKQGPYPGDVQAKIFPDQSTKVDRRSG